MDPKICIREKVTISTVYSTGSTCDESNASGQKVVKVAATAGIFSTGDRVILGRGTARGEEGIINTIQAGESITLVANLAYNHTIDVETDLTAEAALGQKILAVTSATGLLPGETVVIEKGLAGEESGVIASILVNNVTLVANLTKTHAIAAKVNQTGISGIVEKCMASLSSALYKAHYKYMAISLPADWVTAKITFAGCDDPDGTFNQIVVSSNVGEVTIPTVAASKFIALDGECLEAMVAIPYIKLRSGTLGTPVDQGAADKTITIVLKR